jgi:hypothetical protein
MGGPGAQWPESSISRVNGPLFWKALGVQAAAVAVLFGVLVALPLDEDFFENWGFVVGPTAWLACSLLTARVLSLPARLRAVRGAGRRSRRNDRAAAGEPPGRDGGGAAGVRGVVRKL